MGYEVHIDVYDGPFDLLLRLITSEEVDVYSVRLSDIVDGFLAELERLERLDLDLATEFLLIAATLVELKCRRLLPGRDDVELDEDLSLFEARDYLLARLVENRTFQQAAAALVALEQRAQRSHARSTGPDERFLGLEPDLLAGVTGEMLLERVRRALLERPAPPALDTSHVHVDQVSVAEVFGELIQALPTLGRTTMRELTSVMPTTPEVVACFLALLELFKRELVDLVQAETFGEIEITWTGGSGEVEVGALDDYDYSPRLSSRPGQRP